MSLLKLPSVANAGVALPGAEDRGDHLRHRRLAVAAGHRHQRQVEALPPGRGELRRGRRRESATSSPGRPASARPRSASAATAPAALRLGQEVVRIEALAAQGDEQVAGAQAAGVAVHAGEGERRIADEARARQAGGSVAERRHRRRRAPTRRRRAERRRRAPPAPLRHAPRRRTDASRRRCPGSPRGPCRRAGSRRRRRRERTAWRIASARFSITSTSSWPIVPTRICERMKSGDSSRGLSLVTTTCSASLIAIAPISGRLPASRLPPQPNTHQSLPPRSAASGRERGQRLLQRVGRVRVVDDDLGLRRQRRRCRPAASGPAPASARRRPRPLRRGRRRGRAARRASPAGWRRCSRRSAAWRWPRSSRLRGRRRPGPRGRSGCSRRRRRAAPRVETVQVSTGGRRERGGELDPLRIVEVDHRGAQARPGEELRLGLPVGDHVAVVVEVVLGEVGEHRHRHPGAGEAVLGDADRRRLDRAAREAARRRSRRARSAG